LTFQATLRAARLEEEDARAALALPKIEVQLPPLPYLKRLREMVDAIRADGATTGPVPSTRLQTVAQDAMHEAWTYAMQFGRRNIWKVGHTQDLARRLTELNQHIPSEELGECWAILLHERWESSLRAYEMEQRVLGALGPRRTEGERIRCSKVELHAAWARSVQR
jgi:hypothetical protein